MFGEHVGRESRVAVLLETGRNLRPVQSLRLGAGEAEHEVIGEARGVALDLLVQALGGDAVEGGEIGIEDDALAAQDKDRVGDVRASRQSFRARHRLYRLLSVGLRFDAVRAWAGRLELQRPDFSR